MFNYRNFLMTGFRDMVGKQPDYRVIQNANGFFEKGVLTEEDLAELQSRIEEKNTPAEEVAADELTEE